MSIKKPILVVGLLVVLLMPAQTLAISPADKQAVDSGTEFYDPSFAGGGTGVGGCSTAVLPTILDQTAFSQAMEAYIDKYSPPNSPMRGHAADYVAAGIQYGVNPMLIILIARKESTFGTSGSKTVPVFNYYGREASADQPGVVVANGNRFYVYDSLIDGINQETQYVQQVFIQQGITQLIPFFFKFAPPGGKDNNDTKGYIDQINNWMSQATTLADGSLQCNGGNSSLVAIAVKEIGDKEIPDGSNGGPEIQKFIGSMKSETWCADFVSWVYMTAGTPFTGGNDGGWRLPSAIGIVNWMKQYGVYYQNITGSPAPQPGDIVYFNFTSNGSTGGANDHVGLVESVSGTTLNTIEGNDNNAVRRETYSNYTSIAKIKGWGGLKQ